MSVRMLRGIAIGASTVLGLALITSAAHAQAQTSGTRFGVEAAFGTNNDVGIGAGAFVKFHLAEISEHAITGRATFDYFFPKSVGYLNTSYSRHYWELAADGLLDIANSKSDTKPYVGAGLTYSNWSWGGGYCNAFGSCPSANTTNLHIAGGLNFMGNSKLMPFVEAKIELGNGSEFIVKGGVHF